MNIPLSAFILVITGIILLIMVSVYARIDQEKAVACFVLAIANFTVATHVVKKTN